MDRKSIIISIVSVTCVAIVCGAVLLRIRSWDTNHIQTAKGRVPISLTTASSSSSHLTSQAAFILNPYVLDLPDDTVCENANQRALAGLNSKQIANVQSIIHFEHVSIEDDFINGIYKTLADTNSPYWEKWEHLGRIQTPGSSEVLLNARDGDTVIADLEKVKTVISDSEFKSDLNRMQQLVRDAVQKHDLNGLIEYHQMIHDFDYWVVGYPKYLTIRVPGSPKGICYFGVLSGLGGNAGADRANSILGNG